MTREDLLTLALLWTWAMGAGIVEGTFRSTIRTKAQRANWMIHAFVAVASALWPIAVPILAIVDASGVLKRRR